MSSSFLSSNRELFARLCAIPLAATTAAAALAQPLLPAVTVTATRFAEPAATLPFGVSVITAEQIRNSGASTVNEAVIKLLGVVGRLDTSGGNNYSLDLRGFGSTAGSNQVVIVDGQRLNEADLSNAALSSIPIDTVQKIEVLRGTGAVLYGEGATGGVIVITTKAGIGSERRNSAQLYLAGGSLGLRESRGSATLASGGFSVDVAASDRDSDGHRDNFASGAHALSASVQWSNDWLRVGVRGGRDALHSGLPGALSAAQYAANPRQAISLTEYGAVQKNHAGVFVEGFVGAWQLAADASQRRKDYDSVSFGAPYAYSVDATNTSLRARHEGMLGGLPNVFVVGHDNIRWERLRFGTLARARNSAWYVKNDLTVPNSGTRLSIGFRDEELSKSDDGSVAAIDQRNQAWEIGVSQELGTSITAYARVGSSFRLANVDEFTFTRPNATLLPQTSRDTELGVRWRVNATAVEVRWYRSALRNEIGYDPLALGPFSPFFDGANVNFDPTLRQGLELVASHAVTAALDLHLNAALRQARFTSGPNRGNDVMLVPKRTVALRADWRPAGGHALSGGLSWVSSQSPDFANLCNIPGYMTADLRYAYTWGKAELALGIANLTDRKYYTQAFSCNGGVTGGIYPEPGRTITASLLYRF